MAERRQSRGWQLLDLMADLTADGLIRGLAATGAMFITRRALTMMWTKAMGKEPPSHPEDPQVALSEALSWSLLTAVSMQAARLLAVRAAGRRMRSSRDQEPASID
jgi:hypothetical protein